MAKDGNEIGGEPGLEMLRQRLMQVAGVFFGIALTSWTFLYLFGLSMEYDNVEKLTALIPAAGLAAYLWSCKRRVKAACRWALLEFFASSLTSYLVLQFVVTRLI